MLAEGENCLGAIVADGWYRGYLAYKDQRNVFGDRLGLIAQLQISYEDGSTEVVVTDGSWKTTTEGPFRPGGLLYGRSLRRAHGDSGLHAPRDLRTGRSKTPNFWCMMSNCSPPSGIIRCAASRS